MLKPKNHTRMQILRSVAEYAHYHGARLSDYRGWTFEDVMLDAECPGVTVYWGCWTDSDLAMVI